MNKYRANVLFEGVVMVVLTIYVFYALANLFFVANYTYNTPKDAIGSVIGSRRHSFHAQPAATSFISINDRSIVDDKPHVIKLVPIVFLFMPGGFSFSGLKAKLISPQSIIFHITQYSYLSFCKLRI